MRSTWQCFEAATTMFMDSSVQSTVSPIHVVMACTATFKIMVPVCPQTAKGRSLVSLPEASAVCRDTVRLRARDDHVFHATSSLYVSQRVHCEVSISDRSLSCIASTVSTSAQQISGSREDHKAHWGKGSPSLRVLHSLTPYNIFFTYRDNLGHESVGPQVL